MILKGVGAAPGYAMGIVRFMEKSLRPADQSEAADADKEWEKFLAAQKKAKKQTIQLYQQALNTVGQKEAEIFDIHGVLIEDIDFVEYVESEIKEKRRGAEYAVVLAGQYFQEMFSGMEDIYMKERAADFMDISNRILAALQGATTGAFDLDIPGILGAEELTPSQTISLNKDNIQAIITKKGSANSHSAILARTIGIPAVAGLGEALSSESDGAYLIVDGTEGLVIVDPDGRQIGEYKKKKEKYDRERQALEQIKHAAAVTRDGQPAEVCANIADLSDVKRAIRCGAEGVGLFRSEFLYLGRKELPDEKLQFQAYKTVLENMKGKRVVIRTLDLGADKRADCLRLPSEENPALGYRAIRICRNQPEIFAPQIRALLRASEFGRLAVMFPMIASLKELQEIKAFVAKQKKLLEQEGMVFCNKIEWGIIIETPAAAVMSDVLAEEVDFFSIGTNDLIQYTVAADRMNNKVSYLYDVMNPAVLRLIYRTIQNGHSHGIWVGMCGEAAGTKALIPLLLAMGLDEFSVVPSQVPEVKKTILETDVSQISLSDYGIKE